MKFNVILAIITVLSTCNLALANQLTIDFSGTGGGSVNSKPSGIACTQNPCFGNFSSGKSVILTATPDSASTFSGWYGGTCSGTNLCTQVLDVNASITAIFKKAPSVKTTFPVSQEYSYIGDAYNAQQGTSRVTIETLAGLLSENLNFNNSISVYLSGGYDSSFTNVYNHTTLNGSMKISKGRLTVKDLVITSLPVSLTMKDSGTVTSSQSVTVQVSNYRSTETSYSGKRSQGINGREQSKQGLACSL